MENRPNSRPERTGRFMMYINTQSHDIGPDEDRDTHSPIRSLGEYFVMKRAIKQWTLPKHPNYNLIDERLDSFQNWPRGTPSSKSLSEAGFFFSGMYKTIFSFISSLKKFLFSLIPKNFDISGRGDETVCFCCGVGINEWLPSDNAWL